MTSKASSVALLAFALSVGAGGRLAMAAPSYSMEDVTACSSDAMRLCKDKLPDLDAIEACMQANYVNLHPACRARFDKNK